MSVRVEVKEYGTKEVLANLKKVQRQYPEAFAAALYREAVGIFGESQNRVPVDTGRLRASGGVSPPIASSSNPTVTIFYGTNYGAIVHETHPTKGKYLEGPFVEAVSGMAQRLADETERLAASGVGLGVLPPVRGT